MKLTTNQKIDIVKELQWKRLNEIKKAGESGWIALLNVISGITQFVVSLVPGLGTPAATLLATGTAVLNGIDKVIQGKPIKDIAFSFFNAGLAFKGLHINPNVSILNQLPRLIPNFLQNANKAGFLNNKLYDMFDKIWNKTLREKYQFIKNPEIWIKNFIQKEVVKIIDGE